MPYKYFRKSKESIEKLKRKKKMLTVDKLKVIFNTPNDVELAELFGRSGGAVSQWRKNGLPAAIERAARAMIEERGLVAETFVEYKKTAATDPILQMINDRYDSLDEEGREAMAANRPPAKSESSPPLPMAL